MAELTQDTLRELLHYNPETGIFIWKKRSQKHFKTFRGFRVWNAKYAGKNAGYTLCKKQYKYKSLYIRIFRKSYSAHRLAWFYVHGVWPNEIMHDNQDGTDNSIKNLADGTRSENFKNLKMRGNNTSGVMGVQWQKKIQKWRVRVNCNGRTFEGGRLFRTIENAEKRVKELHVEHGFHQFHGRSQTQILELIEV